MCAARISIAIGSWTDKEYKGLLYPRGLPDNERLATYATWFDHVEVNSGFHRVPPLAFVESWVKQTPADFVFDFKLHRDIAANPAAAASDGRKSAYLLRITRPLIE